MADVFVVDACRTPIGRYLGGLAGRSAVDLGIVAAREALARAGADPAQVDETIVGNVLSAGLGQAPAEFHGLQVCGVVGADAGRTEHRHLAAAAVRGEHLEGVAQLA